MPAANRRTMTVPGFGIDFDDKVDQVASEYDVLSAYIFCLKVKFYLTNNITDFSHSVLWDKPTAYPDGTGEFKCNCSSCGYQIYVTFCWMKSCRVLVACVGRICFEHLYLNPWKTMKYSVG